MSTRHGLMAETSSIQVGQYPQYEQMVDGARVPRESQKMAYLALRGERYAVFNGPTGCGKSTVARFLAYDFLQMSRSNRAVVCIPQLPIAESFGNSVVLHPVTEEKIEWIPKTEHVLVDGSDSVNRLVEFLDGEPMPDWQHRVAICSYATLQMARTRVRKWPRVALVLDEVHHSRDGEEEERNGICRLIHEWMDERRGPLFAFSATLMRGDFKSVIGDDRIGRFKVHTYQMHEYLASMVHMKKVEIRFFVGGLGAALSEATRTRVRTIGYLPALEHRATRAIGGKFRMLELLKSCFGRASEFEVSSRDMTKAVFDLLGDVVMADLVDDRSLRARRNILSVLRDAIKEDEEIVRRAAMKAGKDPRALAKMVARMRKERKTVLPDLIACLAMCKEGFDDPSLQRALLIGERGSMVELMQIFGRVLRDFPGKEVAMLDVVLPFTGEPDQEQIASYIKFWLRCMLVEDQMSPSMAARRRMSVVDDIGMDRMAEVLDKAMSLSFSGASDPVRPALAGLSPGDRKEVENVLRQLLGQRAMKLVGKAKDIEYSPRMEVKHLLNGLRYYFTSFHTVDAAEMSRQLTKPQSPIFSDSFRSVPYGF